MGMAEYLNQHLKCQSGWTVFQRLSLGHEEFRLS